MQIDVKHIKHCCSVAMHQHCMTVYMFTDGSYLHVALRDCQIYRSSRYYRDARQAALERQDLSCTYLTHHELESVTTVATITITGISITTILIIIIIINVDIVIVNTINIDINIIIVIIVIPAGETCEKLGLKIPLCWHIRRTRMSTA